MELLDKVGIIGLGNMGGRMAKRMLSQGVPLMAYDISLDVLNPLEKMGAVIASSPEQLAEDCRFVITILPNADIVKEVTLGENGLLQGFHEKSILIDMTSSVPEVTKQIGSVLETKGVRMIDAPVSGGLKRAETGSLTIMVGGDEETFKDTLVVLNHIGSEIIHVGGLGAGHTIKALNNLISATTFAITAEALAVGVKEGLSPSKMLQVINHSTGKNNSSENKFPQHVLSRTFNVGFTLDLMCKDLKIATDIGRESKVPSLVSNTVYQLWQTAQNKMDGRLDHSVFAKLIEDMAGIEITDKKRNRLMTYLF